MSRRIRWLGIVLLACFALLLVQLTNVQFRQANKLANSSHNPKVVAAEHDQPRGDILAANGQVLATSVLAPKGSYYKYMRSYPEGPLYADVVGFDSPIYGKTGVESSYSSYLVAHTQKPQSLSQLLSPVTTTDTVTLTLQPKLQALAESELDGRDGAVVVLDPSTGAIEAMYGNPTYDPNPLVSPDTSTEEANYKVDTTQKDGDGFVPYSDMPYAQTFAPGSTFKVVTASAAYDHLPAASTINFPETDCIPLPDSTKQLCNDGGSKCGGSLTVMLAISCDPGYATVGMDVGPTNMHEEADSFGINSIPPIDIPDSTASVFPAASDFSAANGGLADLAYASIGQYNVSLSALQNALDASAIADDGVIMTPHVVSQVARANGTVVKTTQPTVWKRATSSSTAQSVTQGMEQVVSNPEGTAAGVGFLPQDQVAAKTGTAQAGAYDATTQSYQYDTDWMIAFAPASHPKVAVAVVIPDQLPSTTGAECSGPVVDAMISAALGQSVPTTSPLANCPEP